MKHLKYNDYISLFAGKKKILSVLQICEFLKNDEIVTFLQIVDFYIYHHAWKYNVLIFSE